MSRHSNSQHQNEHPWENWVSENVELIVHANVPLVAISSPDLFDEFVEVVQVQKNSSELLKNWCPDPKQLDAFQLLLKKKPMRWE